MNQLQDYLNQFKDGKLAIRVDSSLAYSALTEILNKYDISLIADSEFPDHLYQRPYVVVDEDAYVYSYKDMNEAYQFKNIYDSVDISELECLDMLQDFKDGKLVVQLINSYQYEKFISYLKENDVTINSAMEYTQNPSHFPYFYMLRPGILTAGESYKAIQDYVHIDKLVPLGVFMPAFEKTMKEVNKVKEIQPNDFADFTSGRLVVHINNSIEHRLFIDYLKEQGLSGKLYPDIRQYNKDNSYFYMYKGKMSGEMLLAAAHYIDTPSFKERYKDMSVKDFCNVDFANSTKIQGIKVESEETVPLALYEQVRYERDCAIEQLNVLGALCDMVRNHYGIPNDIVQDFTESLGSIIDSVRDDLNSRDDRIADRICEYLDTNPNPDDRDGVIHGLLRGEPLEDLIDIDMDDEREL